ncbi:hypothetical protein [Paenibacillus sp. 598K]|uniref:hypothetical protein n=1 Tax=Paenibacillus sp. 598K TaxID=1117987 RepID=UPI000FFEA1F0|nr:hypothetical protein [Paenibacillus sp. 598K]
MKKALGVLLAATIFIAGCGAGNDKANNAHTNDNDGAAVTSQNGDAGGAVDGLQIEEKDGDIVLRLPAGMFEGQDLDQVIEQAKAEGVKDAVKNDDGSLTYTMSKKHHKEMLTEMGQGIADYTKELVAEGTFASVKAVDFAKDFSEFTLTVDQEAYQGSMDAFAAMGLGIQGMMYKMMQGLPEAEQKVTVHLKDENSGDVFDSIVYPDAMQGS